jgi:carbon-monoxide dehydrogenase large subunit
MEPRGLTVHYDRYRGEMEIRAATQSVHEVKAFASRLTGVPESNVRCVAEDVGGGFGQKMSLCAEYVLLVWLARKLRSSVAWTEDRRENLIAAFHSRDQYVTLEGAFDANARLIALRADVVSNVGAYSCFPTTCGVEPLMAMAEMPGPYDVQQYECLARGVLTNTCTMAAYRGVSRPIITFTLERLMDKAAKAFALDPIDIRRRNLIDKFPYTSAMGIVYDEASYKETLEMAVKAADVPTFRARQKEARAKGEYLGIGFATFSERTGYGSSAFAARGMAITPGWETVHVTVDPSGFVEARIGSSPHGQGLRTTLAQIIADEVGVPPDFIKVIHGDTDTAPYGWGTFASRSLVISGGATLIAARKIRAKLIKIAGHMLEAAENDIVLEDGAAKVAGTDRSVTVAAMAREIYTQTHRFKGELEPGLSESGTYDPPGTFSNACHIAFVRLDPETGFVKVERYVVAEDAGRIINPMIADGQVHGGIAQGIGNALLEEIVYDESGGILTANLADYMPPTAHEMPPIELHHMETPSTQSITKAKGLGEGGTIGAPAAVLNAINDALTPFGVEIDIIPATPQRIRAALRKAGQAA